MKDKKRGRPRKELYFKVDKRINIRLTRQDVTALKRICAVTGMNKTEFFRSCIKDKIYDIEFEYDNFGYSDYDSDDRFDVEEGLEKD